MNSSTRYRNGLTILDVTGHIDIGSSPALRKTMLACLKDRRHLAVNLAGVKYIDSSGIASMLEVLKEARNTREKLATVRTYRGSSRGSTTHTPDGRVRDLRERRRGASLPGE